MNETHTKTRGRPAKPVQNPDIVLKAVIQFLQLFLGELLAKRIVSIVLIATGIQITRITEVTGLSKRSICTLKETIQKGDIDGIFVKGYGGGRTGKAQGFEDEIAKELEKNNYQTRQQIADMIYEKFGITMSVSAVGKLLKKTASSG
jgi:transposase